MENIKVEDYIKAIYQVSSTAESGTATTGEVAEKLSVTPGSVTTMLQRLAESGLVNYQSHRGTSLSPSGEKLALNVLRRHRLIELFLVKTLGLNWDEIHAEAENIEHAVSANLISRIDAFLGYPACDPHGDPIPNEDGSFRSLPGQPLSESPAGFVFIIERVLDQSPDFLRYLTDGKLLIGTKASVVENHRSAGVITVRIDDRDLSMSREVARNILVHEAKS